MALVQQMQCDVCGRKYENDGTVRRIRLALDGPIIRTRQPLGKEPDAIEASHIDHLGDVLIDEACETCRDEIRKLLTRLKARMRGETPVPKAKAKKAKTRG